MSSIEWTARAACTGKGDLYFPSTSGGRLNSARKVCAECPVQFECREYGIRMLSDPIPISHGLWGGMTVDELRDSLLAGQEKSTAVCVRPGCKNKIPNPITPGKGRPRRYCSNFCSRAYWDAKYRQR